MNYTIIGEIIEVEIDGEWMDAEVLDVTGDMAYVYVLDLHEHRNVTVTESPRRQAARSAIRTQIQADQSSGANRDAKALRAEAAWLKKNGGR